MEVFLQSFGVSFQIVIQIFLLGLIGWAAVKRGIFNAAMVQAFARLMIDLLIPGLLFIAMVRAFDLKKLASLSTLMGLSLGWTAAGLGLGWLAVKLWPRRDAPFEDRVVIAMSGLQNAFYLPAPIVIAILPPAKRDEGMLYVGACLIILNVLQWTLGVMLLKQSKSGDSSAPAAFGIQVGRVTIPWPTIGVAAGCICAEIPIIREVAQGQVSGLGWALALPLRALDLLTPCVGPLAMILLGSILAISPFAQAVRWRTAILVVLIRLLIIPGLVLAFAHYFVSGSPIFYMVMAIEAAAPPATNLTLIAIRFSDQGGHVSSVLLVTYLVGILTLPIWIALAGML